MYSDVLCSTLPWACSSSIVARFFRKLASSYICRLALAVPLQIHWVSILDKTQCFASSVSTTLRPRSTHKVSRKSARGRLSRLRASESRISSTRVFVTSLLSTAGDTAFVDGGVAGESPFGIVIGPSLPFNVPDGVAGSMIRSVREWSVKVVVLIIKYSFRGLETTF